VTVAFRKDFQDRWQWFVKQEPDGGRGGLSASNVYYPSEEQVALIKGGHSSRGSYISKGLIRAEPGQPLQLMRYRYFAQEPSRKMEREPAEGVVIWIWEGERSSAR